MNLRSRTAISLVVCPLLVSVVTLPEGVFGAEVQEGSSYTSLISAGITTKEEQSEKIAKKIAYYERILVIFKKLGYKNIELIALKNLGEVYELIEIKKAFDYYKQALSIAEQLGDFKSKDEVIISLNDIAWEASSAGDSAYSSLNLAEALKFHHQALEIYKFLNNKYRESYNLAYLGNTYDILGQHTKALQLLLEALDITREKNYSRNEFLILGFLGELHHYSLRQYSKALEYHQQALAISQKLGYDNISSFNLSNMGLAFIELNEPSRALESFQKALNITSNDSAKSYALYGLGMTYSKLGRSLEAINILLQSISTSRKAKNIWVERESLSTIGDLLNQQKQIELSIIFYKEAVNTTERIRKNLRVLSREEQQTYTKTVENTYRNLADRLLQQNRIIEALQVLDLLKVQELEDYLKNIKGSDRSAQGVRLLAPELAISDKLLAISPDNSQDINNQLANQIQQLTKSEINKVPDYLNQIPQGTVLLYPFILGDRLEIILFAPNNLPIRRTTTISKDQLETLIRDYRVGLLDPSSEDFKEPSIQLYNLLIKPIEAELVQFNTKTILYAPDGQLRYIPIAALYDGKQLLVEKYQISNLIAYTLSDFTPQPQNAPNILAGAFGGKAGDRKFGQTALPATVREVQAIANSFQNSVTLIEEQFSRKAIESKFKNHNILHLATHAEFNVGSPDQSFIIFGNGDKIRLNEIADWQMPNIDLIILSACQTGLGILGSGVEILGFGYQVQKAGAKQAIASLWKVDDNKTSVLMTAFYAELQKGNVTATEALRRAQVSLIKSKDYNHPYYWAAFFAIGNGL
ncbi:MULTISPECIES: CHAT domain-containing protein [Pseudanabaena]|uniref:CHAT domain-containing protein n=1 Tax=Pseudanabaena TaxID=1152 RepID=UPI002479F4C2|nr:MULTISPECIES: CHAT domain-containing protein [Pseudanabaena]MEA5485463.1 CHAT domain-containing protein [Pseudanabaena sp. CCNP1317]WGS73681.1 CHAT domain-containing protein [Pseudanabaena galeata CCNP1313]